MRALVTGGAGFLGSHLCDRLLAEGYDVVCLDFLKSGRKDNIAHLSSNPKFTFVLHDVTHPFRLDGTLDYVLHFASLASPKDYVREPIHTLKVGALGTHHMLGLAKAQGCRFLLASTSEIYGDPEVFPQPESYWGNVNSVGVRSCYDESKRVAEALTVAYHRQHGLDVRIVRIFNTYGPRMRLEDGRVLPAFISQALRGEPLTMHGDGSQTRSFCYVDDLIEGIVRLMKWQPPAGAEGIDRVFNLGNPDEVTMLQFAQDVLEITGSKSPIQFLPLPPDDPKRRCPDTTRARTLLDWSARVMRKDGIRRTIPYFRAELGLGDEPPKR